MLTFVEISIKVVETFAASNAMATCITSVRLRAASCCSMRASSAVVSTVEAALEKELLDVEGEEDDEEEDPDADSRATTDNAMAAAPSTRAASATPFHSRVAACVDASACPSVFVSPL